MHRSRQNEAKKNECMLLKSTEIIKVKNMFKEHTFQTLPLALLKMLYDPDRSCES
jgi:hypothetical protein